jgi:hypothetical protein
MRGCCSGAVTSWLTLIRVALHVDFLTVSPNCACLLAWDCASKALLHVANDLYDLIGSHQERFSL